jgi:creatinine amidohydrolase
MTDIILSLKTQGFKKVLILQCHGGIFIMTPVVRDLNAKYNPDLMVFNFDPITVWPRLHEEGILEDSPELHAGEGETSMMLVIAPETVHMEKAVDFVPDVPRSYLNYGCLLRYTPSGVWGSPTLGSAEKGEKMLSRTAEIAADEMNKAFIFMTGKDKLNYSNF